MRLSEVITGKRSMLRDAKLTCQYAQGVDPNYQPLDVSRIRNIPRYVLKRYLEFNHTRIVVRRGPPNKKLAVIVPHRYREKQLSVFIPYMKSFLEKEGLSFRIIVVHQADERFFNKGVLCNAAFLHIQHDYDYFCIHDVDYIPEVSCYAYVNHPVALYTACTWPGCFGGAVLFPKEDYVKINGFSNEYSHWGWEDTDQRDRCFLAGLTPLIYPKARYWALAHRESSAQTPDGVYRRDGKNIRKLKRVTRVNRDHYNRFTRGEVDFLESGLNTVSYELVSRKEYPDYTRLNVALAVESATKSM